VHANKGKGEQNNTNAQQAGTEHAIENGVIGAKSVCSCITEGQLAGVGPSAQLSSEKAIKLFDVL